MVIPLCARTKFVKSSLIGVCDFGANPSICEAHCSQRCFSIFLPPRISVRCTVAGLLHFSHFINRHFILLVGLRGSNIYPA